MKKEVRDYKINYIIEAGHKDGLRRKEAQTNQELLRC